jgi:hypothetical protein
VRLESWPESDKVLEYHLVAVRGMLDNYGIADPTAFDAKLNKAGRVDQTWYSRSTGLVTPEKDPNSRRGTG